MVGRVRARHRTAIALAYVGRVGIGLEELLYLPVEIDMRISRVRSESRSNRRRIACIHRGEKAVDGFVEQTLLLAHIALACTPPEQIFRKSATTASKAERRKSADHPKPHEPFHIRFT